jgi:hypothetical protein
MTDLVPVRVPCPSGQHPDGDSVSLRPKLGLAAGIAAQQTIQGIGKGTSTAEVTGTLLELYLRSGVAEWDLHDDEGNPIELTPETLQTELLDDFGRSEPIANVADGLYYGVVVAPLVAAVSRSSQATPPGDSTSASTGSPASRRKRSKPSSTSTIQTVVTAPTSA